MTKKFFLILFVVVAAAVGCGNVESVSDADGGTGGTSATGGSGGSSSVVRENDPTCTAAFPTTTCSSSSASGACVDGRLACAGGSCIGTSCCLGCIDGDGKCVGGDATSDCGGVGYDCHVCDGSNFPYCTANPGETDRGCSTNKTPPSPGEANVAACTVAGSSHAACAISTGAVGTCVGTSCCTGCVDVDGKCHVGDSAIACGILGSACVVEQHSDFQGCG